VTRGTGCPWRPASRLAGVVLAGALALAPSVGSAQIPPSPDELASYTGLHRAAARGDADGIRQLLAGRADPDARDARGRTPLHVAAFAGQAEAMRTLVTGGADPNALDAQRYDVVTIAAVRGDVATLRLALALGARPGNVTSPYDGTALIAAAHLGQVDVVRVLLDGGAPLDHVNNLGWTALLEAVILGDGGPRHVAVLRMLVDAGANVGLADRQGRTPLDHARARTYTEMIALLEAAARR
jgi:ankyrin repeat protein